MLGDVFKYLASEASTILDAPVIFGMAVLACVPILWWLMSLRFRGVIDILRERLQARDEKIADYKAKLEGAEPEEARAHIKDLEARLAAIEPKRLKAPERQAIAANLRGSPGKVYVLIDDTAKRPLAGDLVAAFREGGWTVDLDGIIGFFDPDQTGIVVVVDNADDLQPIQGTAVAALRAGGLQPKILSGLSRHPMTPADLHIRVTQTA